MGNQVVIKPDSRLRTNKQISLDSLRLSPQEGYLLSRIYDGITIQELNNISPFDQTTTAVILKRLIDSSAVIVENPRHQIVKTSPSNKQENKVSSRERVQTDKDAPTERLGRGWRYDGFIFSPADLAEEVDLDDEMKKLILYLDGSLDKLTFYDILNILPSATKQEIKDAYYKATLKFHPDVYFGRNLGSYKARLNRIFKRMNEAKEVLLSDDERKEYDAKLVKLGVLRTSSFSDQMSQRLRKSREETEEEKRRRKERRLKKNPVLAKIMRAKGFFEQALQDKKAGDIISAYNNVKLAVQFDPRNETYSMLAKELEIMVAKQKAEGIFKKALEAEEKGHPSYMSMFEGLAKKFPDIPKYQFKFAKVCADINDYKEALRYCKRALRIDPRNEEYLMFLGRMQEEVKDFSAAAETYSKVLEFNPNNKEAKQKADSLKKYVK